MTKKIKNCPFCKKEIPATAVLCEFCERAIPAQPKKTKCNVCGVQILQSTSHMNEGTCVPCRKKRHNNPNLSLQEAWGLFLIVVVIGSIGFLFFELPSDQVDNKPERKESQRPPRSVPSPAERAQQARLEALTAQQEADQALFKYAKETRQELMDKALAHQSSNVGNGFIDSFELPGNEFVTCRWSLPGPVYECNEFVSR